MRLCNCCCCTPKRWSICLGVFGLVLVAIGIAAVPVIHMLIHQQIEDQLPLTGSSSLVYDAWRDPIGQGAITYMQYHIYNLTNHHEVLRGGKPKVEIVGPYTYIENRYKFNISWNDDQSIIYYKANRTFTLIDTPCGPNSSLTDLCTRPESDVFIAANVPVIGAVTQLVSMAGNSTLAKIAVDVLVDALLLYYDVKQPSEFLFMKRNMSQIIWGYRDDLLGLLGNVSAKVNMTISPFYQLQTNKSWTDYDLPSAVYTGKHGINNIGTYIEFDGLTKLTNWTGCDQASNDFANMLNGTEGFQFQPNLDSGMKLQVFTEDLGRSADIVNSESTSYKGIDLLRFTIAPYVLDSANSTAENCAFSDFGPRGVLNMTAFVSAPVFASKPSFLDADPIYRTWVEGIAEPDRAAHDTFLDVEPWTGSLFRAHQRLQINVQVKRFDGIINFGNLTDEGFYLPVMWADEWAELPDKFTNDFKNSVQLFLNIADGTRIGASAGGALLCVISLGMAIVLYRRAKKEHRFNLQDENAPLLGGGRYA